MTFGKTIELYLSDGTADRLVTAELSNWNGKAFKISRSEVSICTRDDLKNPGVYFLFCEETNGEDSVYIGESENVLDRLLQHLSAYNGGKENYYWNNAVVFIGRDLNKALIRYLENRLVQLTKEIGRYKVLTKTTYQNTVLKESQISSMEEFVENIKVLISALNYKVLTPIPQLTKNNTVLYCTGGKADAKGFISPSGLTVLKGSKVSPTTAKSFETGASTYFNLRNKLINDLVIEDNIFLKDYEFSSPSAAAAVVLGRSANGKTEWKDKEGKKLQEI